MATHEPVPLPQMALGPAPAAPAKQHHPPGGPAAHPPPATWSTGLCGCFEDVGNCLITFFCPCITFGRIAEIVDRGSSACGPNGAAYCLMMHLTGLQCLCSFPYRTKLRAQYGLPESPCADCLVHCFCEQCALCQAYRELQNRGIDVNIGWQANMERQSRGITEPPPNLAGGMTR